MTLMFLNGTAIYGQKVLTSRLDAARPASTRSAYRFFTVGDGFSELLPLGMRGRRIDGEMYDVPEPVLSEQLLSAEPNSQFTTVLVVRGVVHPSSRSRPNMARLLPEQGLCVITPSRGLKPVGRRAALTRHSR